MTASKKQKPDVSFVMTVYNKEYYLPAVLKALLNQTGLKNPEYIFVDDLSKDRSVEIIEEMTRGIENVTIVRKDKNEGISISINRGIALARGECWIQTIFFRSIRQRRCWSLPTSTMRIWFTVSLPKQAKSRWKLQRK